MNEQSSVFSIRYVRLKFVLEMLEDSVLPMYKSSALRGGMGEMLLRANCVRDRNCETCDFRDECIVQRTMYSRFENKPGFVTRGESIGYVLECEDYREVYPAGGRLEFYLILFGKTIVYLNQYLQALYALGQSGLGKNLARFRICGIYNTHLQPILEGDSILMENYRIETLADYIKYRMQKIDVNAERTEIRFFTPLTQKYQREFLTAFDIHAVLKSLQRRIYMLDCFEGIEGGAEYEKELPAPELLEQNVIQRKVPRYSSRQDQKMFLKGISGNMIVGRIPEACYPYLLAGERTHIGKNTSFGFGHYRLMEHRR